MKRHRWSIGAPCWIGREARVYHCLAGGEKNDCLCRRYATRGRTVLGYLPLSRDIKQGLLRTAPPCRAR